MEGLSHLGKAVPLWHTALLDEACSSPIEEASIGMGRDK